MPRHVLSNRIPPLIAIASGNATAAAVMPVVPAYIFHRRDTRHVVLIGEGIAVAEAVRILRDGNHGYGLMIFTVWAKAAIAIELGLELNTAPDSKRPVLPSTS
ncbi:MAG: hypothetical protein O7E56_06140 [SAR324 cluster bacterium]|nr:hypothetical protein [SAR324 cluster bacterium]